MEKLPKVSVMFCYIYIKVLLGVLLLKVLLMLCPQAEIAYMFEIFLKKNLPQNVDRFYKFCSKKLGNVRKSEVGVSTS